MSFLWQPQCSPNWCYTGFLGTGLDSQPHRWQVAFSPHWGAARSWRRPTATRWCACSATSPTSTPACSTATTTSVPAACEAEPAMGACVAHSAGKGHTWTHLDGGTAQGWQLSTALPPASPKLAWVGVPIFAPSQPHRHPSVVRGGTGLPPVDRLLQFLVDSSADSEEDVQCANCDRCCTKAVRAARWTRRGE